MSAKRLTRGPMSRIDRLDPEIRDYIHKLLRDGVPQVEILRRLRTPLAERGERPISAAALSREATRIETLGRDIRESRALADAWMAKLGERPSGAVGALTIEIVRTLAFRVVQRVEAEDLDLSEVIPMLNELGLLLQRLERAGALSAKSEREMYEAWAAQATKATDGVARAAGLTEDTAAAIRAAIEGAGA